MFNQYEDIMTVTDVAEALFIGKNRTYQRLPDRQDLEGSQSRRAGIYPCPE